ncbi:hypothetical protein OEZ85_001923 [Tetradesmus obliquus]|uniref:EF-hand domain-containing protein n=1 Tax=Tetradesmus obliquus TaxID=3088 RepID=A0ABY8U1C0_TETOB|nr:hypothetical protein OEZ85_001923 [Tetradesmus obliquus]
MLVLEVLLDATAEYFYTKVQHLNWMLESIGSDLRQPPQPGGAIDRAHQLIPIQKFLTRVKNDVKETCEAIQAALEDDETLQELCLSWHLQQKQHTRWVPVELQRHRAGAGGSDGAMFNGSSNGNGNGTASGLLAAAGADAAQSGGPAQQVRLLTEMLESYEREIQSLEGSINEAEEDLENTRSIWHMQLDSSRNHIIMVNLWLSMLNISVMATTILPAFYGMNLGSGLEEADPATFYAVCGVSMALAALSYPLSRYWYTRNWRRISENELFEQKMLRVLLVQNIEDIDEIVRALQQRRYARIDRRAFRQLVVQTLGSRAMPPSQIDFLYQCFDRDRDGFLSEAELIRPLNTFYHASSNGSSSSSSSSGSSMEPSQQAGLAGNLTGAAGLAGNMQPPQMGSLQAPSISQPDDAPSYDKASWGEERDSSRDTVGPDQQRQQGVFSRHAVRRSPRELQGALKKKQLQKQDETNWEDDERYGWD